MLAAHGHVKGGQVPDGNAVRFGLLYLSESNVEIITAAVTSAGAPVHQTGSVNGRLPPTDGRDLILGRTRGAIIVVRRDALAPALDLRTRVRCGHHFHQRS